jgi:hypothetical protein
MSARNWTWAFGAAFSVVSSGCATSDEDLVEPVSVEPVSEPANAVTPCVGVPADSDATAYGERRVFLEAQSWWGERRADGTVPKRGNAEHIHIGMCFPLQQEVSGTKTLRVRMMGHKLPVGTFIRRTNLHDPSGGGLPEIDWDRTVLSSDNGNVEEWRTVQVNTASIPNGRREFRVLTDVIRPDNAEIHVSSGWCWIIKNGTGAPVDSGTCAETQTDFSIMARGWYDCFEYKLAEVKDWPYPYSGIPRSTAYTLKIAAREGAGIHNLITGWEVRLDPDFHNGVNGQSVTIPGSLLTAGVHRLVVIGSSNDNCTSGAGITPQNGELSAVQSVPIKVN